MRPVLCTLTGSLCALIVFAPVLPAIARGYQPGESVTYRIQWGLITAGEARMEVREEVLPNGRRAHRFISSARGTTFMDRVFPVRNRIESLYDPLHKRTLFNSKELREGNYRRSYLVRFDHTRRIAHYHQKERSGNDREDAPWKERSGASENLPVQFQDMLTAIYFNRSHGGGEPGDAFSMPVYDDSQLIQMKMEILERQTLTLRINQQERSLPALRVRPLIRTTGLFRSKGETNLFISDDDHRLILRVDAVVPRAGAVKLILDRVQGVPGF